MTIYKLPDQEIAFNSLHWILATIVLGSTVKCPNRVRFQFFTLDSRYALAIMFILLGAFIVFQFFTLDSTDLSQPLQCFYPKWLSILYIGFSVLCDLHVADVLGVYFQFFTLDSSRHAPRSKQRAPATLSILYIGFRGSHLPNRYTRTCRCGTFNSLHWIRGEVSVDDICREHCAFNSLHWIPGTL